MLGVFMAEPEGFDETDCVGKSYPKQICKKMYEYCGNCNRFTGCYAVISYYRFRKK